MAKRKNYPWVYPALYLLFAAVIWYSMRQSFSTPSPKQVPYSEFLAEVRAGHVKEARIDQTMLVGTLKPDDVKKGQSPEISTERLPGIDETSLLKDFEDHQVTFSGHTDQSGWWTGLLSWVVPILFFVFIYGYGARRFAQGPGGPMTFGKSRAKIHDQSTEIKE